MKSTLLSLATRLVRAWTRLYTLGLPRAERTARRAEIDSDLWEFEHDPDAPRGARAAAQVLARLLIGIPDDLAWRMNAGATAHGAPVRALAAAGMITGPRRISAFGLSATIHVVAFSTVIWVASRGPMSSPDRAPAAQDLAAIEHRLAPDASLSAQIVAHAPNNQPVMTMPVQSGATSATTRLVGMVRTAVVAVAARVGLITVAAEAPPSASGPSAQIAQLSPSLDRFIAKVRQNRYSLSVQNGQFAGTGADVLQSAIAESRFVLLGENHGVRQNPEFGAAVCDAARSEPFRAMAIEEGPLAAAELENWVHQQNGLTQLAAFERRFPHSLNLYSSREEFEMLEQCAHAAQGEFHLWGVNQEAFGAAGPILSRILESHLGEDARAAMRQLSQKNDDAYRKASQSGSIADLFMLSADDRELARAAAVLQRDGSDEARSLFASLIESHEINRISPADYDNARRRERLMKTRLAAEYERAARTAVTPPRVLLKLGAFHVYRGLNPVRGHGVGNYVAEFAAGQRAQSLHIRLMPVKGEQPNLQPILGSRLQSHWTLFDLRPLRHDFNALAGATTHELATLVFGIDMLVLVPEDTPSTRLTER